MSVTTIYVRKGREIRFLPNGATSLWVDGVVERTCTNIEHSLAHDLQGTRTEIERLTRRETELLEANNRYLERARKAERVLRIFREFWHLNVARAQVGAGHHAHPMWALIAETLGGSNEQVKSKVEHQFIWPDNRRPLAEIEESPL